MDSEQEGALTADPGREASPPFLGGEPPWDKGLATPYPFRMLMVAGMFVCLVSYAIVALSMLWILMDGIFKQGFQEIASVEIAMLIVFFGVPALLIWPLWRWFGRMQRWSSLGKGLMLLEMSQSPICFVPTGILVWLHGSGEFAFHDGGLRLSAWGYERDTSFDPETLAGFTLYAPVPLVFRYSYFFAPLLIINAGYLARKWVARRREKRHASADPVEAPLRTPSVELELRPEDLHRVRCSGPLVDLTLSPSAKKRIGVRWIRLVIRTDLRRDFFHQFDAAFPGKLPPAYHKAVAAEELR